MVVVYSTYSTVAGLVDQIAETGVGEMHSWLVSILSFGNVHRSSDVSPHWHGLTRVEIIYELTKNKKKTIK